MLLSGVECRRTEEEGLWNQTTGKLISRPKGERGEMSFISRSDSKAIDAEAVSMLSLYSGEM